MCQRFDKIIQFKYNFYLFTIKICHYFLFKIMIHVLLITSFVINYTIMLISSIHNKFKKKIHKKLSYYINFELNCIEYFFNQNEKIKNTLKLFNLS